MEDFEITSIDVVGYPDYLEYDLSDARAVQSWWKFRMTRKADGKKIILPALYIHDFDEDGKIVRSVPMQKLPGFSRQSKSTSPKKTLKERYLRSFWFSEPP